MAVVEEDPIASSVANGVTTSFPFSFSLRSAADLVVTGTLDGIVTTYSLGVHYTVSGVGGGSGSADFLAAPASGTIITRYRRTQLVRSTDYQDNGDLPADTLNADFDRLWQAVQELDSGSRAPANVLRGAAGDVLAEIPGPSARASRMFGFDAVGQPVMMPTGALTTADALAYIPAGAGGVARTVQEMLREMQLAPTSYGAVPGLSSSTAAFRAALVAGAGGVIRVPRGSYRLPFSEVNGFSIPAGTVIEGDHRETTELVLAPDSSTYRNLFVLAANVTFRNLKITCLIPSGGSVSLFAGDQTGLLVEDCYLDGGMTNSGATLSHSAYGVNFANTGTVTDVIVRGCDITRFRYFFLKTNAATSIQRRISVEHCDFFTNIGEDCSFNSPAVGAVMDDIQVYACRFRDSRAKSASVVGLYVAFASCTNWRVGLCDFRDSITDAVHIEEASSRGTVTANTFNVDGNGIVIQDNNVGGTALMPTDLTVTGNTITKSGTAKAASTYGIWLVNDATSEVPAKRVVITNNVCSNFFAGVQTGASGDDACVIADNTAHNCARGFGLMAFISAVHDNTSSACDVGVVFDSSTMAVRHRFIECTTPVDAINRPAHLVDPSFLWAEFNVGAGATVNKATFALGTGDRVYGEWAVSAYCDTPADNANRRNRAQWDGTTWTSTSLMAIEPGAIALTVNNTGSVMNIGTFAASAKTGVRLAASLSGSVVVAV